MILVSDVQPSFFTKKAVDELVVKMEKAVDPEDSAKNIKTQVNKLEINMPAQKIKMNVTATDKYPNKSRTVTEIPGMMRIFRVYDGTKAWEYSKAMGLREITGKELDSIKLEMALKNPKNKMRDIFSDIQVPDKTEKVGKFNCYKLTCTPR